MRAERRQNDAIEAGLASPAAGRRTARWLAPGAFAAALLARLVGPGGAAAGELARPGLNVLLGAAAVALFARWVERRFGSATALLAALFLACSPALVRASHELAPHALALALAVWALDAADRWIEAGAERFPVELTAVALGAALAHPVALALWFPVAAAWLEARLEERARSPFGAVHVLALALSIVPLALRFGALAFAGGPRPARSAAPWTFYAIERRFEDLLFRGYPGQSVVAHATLLFGALAVVGFAVVARRRGGLAVLAGVIGGSFLVELAFGLAGRASEVSADLFGLFFLHAAIAAGIVVFAGTVAKWNRTSGIATAAILAGAVVATSVDGLLGYAQHSRSDGAIRPSATGTPSP